MSDQRTLAGKVGIVTGAGRGVGRGIALALAKEGADVAVLELDPVTGRRTAEEIVAVGRRAIALEVDVRDGDACAAAVAETVESFGGIDVLVNNAQQARAWVPFVDATDDDMLLAWETGPLAAFRLMKACHPHLRDRRGSVVNLGSSAGTLGLPRMASYASAKEALRALTKVAALEWGVDGIRVNTVCPWASSDHWNDVPEAQRAAQVKSNPLRRIGDCETDVGAVVAFLASDAASYVTAQTIMIDGGWMGYR